MMALRNRTPERQQGYPAQDELERYDNRRSRRGQIWAVVFALSTLVGVVVLLVLLLSIISDSFGYTAVVNEYDPEQLVVWVYENEMLNAPNTAYGEDDRALAEGVAANSNAAGLFGYAFYLEEAGKLKALAVDGVQPSAETAEDGEYPFARPLLLYADAKVMDAKPEVAASVDYFLRNASAAVDKAGFFPVADEQIEQGLEALDTLGHGSGEDATTEWTSDGFAVAGSSTVAPVVDEIVDSFVTDTGYAGEIQTGAVGTIAGLYAFCIDKTVDVVTASRPMLRQEINACKRKPVAFHIGTDAVVAAVNPAIGLDNVTAEQLQAIFATAETWSEVDASLPDDPILRFIPGPASGTLDVFGREVFGSLGLADLSRGQLVLILENFLSEGRVRALNAQGRLIQRTHGELLELVESEVVQPEYVATYSLFRSLLDKQGVAEEIAAIPDATMVWKNWVSWDFVTSPQSSDPASAGVATAILGSLWVVAIAILFAIPLGIGAAVWLEEYADKNSWFANVVDTNINNLAGVPSIIYGLLGLAVFVRFLEPFTSGQLFGVADDTTANGRTILSAGLTLGLLILPLVIINSREAIRAVPSSLREASYGMGATRWQTTWVHVLPNAITGMLTGSILAVSRAIGETAPLVVVGASTFINTNPSSPFAKFTTLPTQIYQWTARPQPAFQNIAAAASLVLLVMLILLNAVAVYMRNRYSRHIV